MENFQSTTTISWLEWIWSYHKRKWSRRLMEFSKLLPQRSSYERQMRRGKRFSSENDIHCGLFKVRFLQHQWRLSSSSPLTRYHLFRLPWFCRQRFIFKWFIITTYLYPIVLEGSDGLLTFYVVDWSICKFELNQQTIVKKTFSFYTI